MRIETATYLFAKIKIVIFGQKSVKKDQCGLSEVVLRICVVLDWAEEVRVRVLPIPAQGSDPCITCVPLKMYLLARKNIKCFLFLIYDFSSLNIIAMVDRNFASLYSDIVRQFVYYNSSS